MPQRSPKRSTSKPRAAKPKLRRTGPKRRKSGTKRKLKIHPRSRERKSKSSRMKRGAPKDDREYMPEHGRSRTEKEVAQILIELNRKKALTNFTRNERDTIKRILIDKYAPFTPSIPTDWRKSRDGTWIRLPGQVEDYDADARVNAVEIARRALASERTGDTSLISRRVMGGKNIGNRVLSLLDTAIESKSKFEYQNNPRLRRNKIREDLGLKPATMLVDDHTRTWKMYINSQLSQL
jgi:hypothetical protein